LILTPQQLSRVFDPTQSLRDILRMKAVRFLASCFLANSVRVISDVGDEVVVTDESDQSTFIELPEEVLIEEMGELDDDRKTVTKEEWDEFEMVRAMRKTGYTCKGFDIDGESDPNEGKKVGKERTTVFAANTEDLLFDCSLWKMCYNYAKKRADAKQTPFAHLMKKELDDGGKKFIKAGKEVGIKHKPPANAENIFQVHTYEGWAYVHEGWAKSVMHCENMMDSSNNVMAVAYAKSTDAKLERPHYWMQLFAKRKTVKDTSCYPTGKK